MWGECEGMGGGSGGYRSAMDDWRLHREVLWCSILPIMHAAALPSNTTKQPLFKHVHGVNWSPHTLLRWFYRNTAAISINIFPAKCLTYKSITEQYWSPCLCVASSRNCMFISTYIRNNAIMCHIYRHNYWIFGGRKYQNAYGLLSLIVQTRVWFRKYGISIKDYLERLKEIK